MKYTVQFKYLYLFVQFVYLQEALLCVNARGGNGDSNKDIVFRTGRKILARHKEEKTSDFTVATYNLWNIMFHWEVRKHFIAEMIQMQEIDVIGFQEVRSHMDKSRNQLFELQQLLPSHKFILYHPTRVITQERGKRPPGWELEGIGILSKYQILSYHAVNFTKGVGEDPTPRALLSANLIIDGAEISVIVTHFSYDKSEQCQNSWDFLTYLHSARADKMVLLGDFNVYKDYSWPLQLLKTGALNDDAPEICKRMEKPWFHGHPDFKFYDAWRKLKPRHLGYTFSNMPSPGLESRPDRIIIPEAGLKLDTIFLLGRGLYYQRNYRKKLYWARLDSVYETAQRHANGELYDSSCAWDCGPHGVCRCGICVKSPREDECDETFCGTCGPANLRYYQFLRILLCTISILIVIGVLVFLSRFCPLVARVNFCKKLQRSFLNSKYFMLAMVIVLIITCWVCVDHYNDVLELVESQIEEELYPSDHLMVVARLTID